MATLQVKGIDDNLYAALGARARRDGRSISQAVISMIQDSLSRPDSASSQNATNEFLSLAGSWEDERPAEEIVADLRKRRKSRKRTKDRDDVFA